MSALVLDFPHHYAGNVLISVSKFCVEMLKVITKSKVGSLTMQPAKHDVTGIPLYRMYPYPIGI